MQPEANIIFVDFFDLKYTRDVSDLHLGAEMVSLPAAKKLQQTIAEITDKLEQGVHDLFNSERYREYLATMAKLCNYSPYNSILISMQKPDGCRSKCRCKRRSSDSSTCKVDAGSHLIASGFPRWRTRKAKKKVEVKTAIQNA